MLRLIDGKTLRPIPTRAEAVEKAQARAYRAEQAVRGEKARADALAAEVERLQKLLREGKP